MQYEIHGWKPPPNYFGPWYESEDIFEFLQYIIDLPKDCFQDCEVHAMQVWVSWEGVQTLLYYTPSERVFTNAMASHGEDHRRSCEAAQFLGELSGLSYRIYPA